MKIELIGQTMGSLMHSLQYPVYIANNILLTVEIKLIDSPVPLYLTEEKIQHLKIVLGQLNFTISYLEKTQRSQWGFYSVKNRILLSNQKRIL